MDNFVRKQLEDWELLALEDTFKESSVPPERATEMKNWLKHNLTPKDQVVQYMKNTHSMRAGWIRENHNLTTVQINAEYPRLFDTPGMIEQDFRMVYGDETADMFVSKCESSAELIYAYACSQGSSWKQHLNIQPTDGDDTPDFSLPALQVLPLILPSGLITNQSGKKVRASRAEALASFVDVKPVGTNLPTYLDGTRQRQPYILILGRRMEPAQSFVIIDGLAIEAASVIKAVDICFKAFYILDVQYPKECKTTWEFVQKFFFKIDEGKGTSSTSPGVLSLRAYLESN